MPEFAELSNLENWIHFNPNILKQGRASYYVDPKVPEDQREELLAKLTESDPKIERLKAINEDKGNCIAIQALKSSDWKDAGPFAPTAALNSLTTWANSKEQRAATLLLLFATHTGQVG